MTLLDDKQRRFIRYFSELRNSLVHRLDNLGFTFENYVSTLDTNRRRNLKESVAWFADDELMRKEWETIAEGQPESRDLHGRSLSCGPLCSYVSTIKGAEGDRRGSGTNDDGVA